MILVFSSYHIGVFDCFWYTFCIMAEQYRRMKVNELKALLAQKGVLNTQGFNKAGLVQKLIDLDANNRDEENESVENVSDTDDGIAETENSRIRELELLLQLEKLRTGMRKAGTESTANDISSTVTCPPRLSAELPKSPKMGSTESDFLSFISAWEKAAILSNVPQKDSVRFLPSCLNEAARKVFALQTITVCSDYVALKDVLSESFQASPEAYYDKMTSMKRTGTESYKLFLQRVTQRHDLYLQARRIDSFEALKDDCIMTLFLNSLSASTRQFVMQRQPINAVEAASYTDLSYSVSKFHNSDKPRGVHQRYGAKKTNLPETAKTEQRERSTVAEIQSNSRTISCYVCSGPHPARLCDKKVSTD